MGSNLRRLTTDPRNEGDPVWTPDGTQIVYTTTRGSATQIAIMPADGGEGRILTTTPGSESLAHGLTRWSEHRVCLRPGRQSGDLCDESRWEQPAPAHQDIRTGIQSTILPQRRPGLRGRAGRTLERVAGHASPLGRTSASLLLQTEEPVPAIAVSREGDRLAYVVGKITDAAKGRVEFSFFLQSTAPGSPPVSVPLTAWRADPEPIVLTRRVG